MKNTLYCLFILITLFNYSSGVKTDIFINNRFAMLVSKNCDQTIFIDTDKNNHMKGLEYLVNLVDIELVTSYSEIYNYTSNLNIKEVSSFVGTENYLCKTSYTLNKKNLKKNDIIYDEIIFIIFVLFCPSFTIYHIIFNIYYAIKNYLFK